MLIKQVKVTEDYVRERVVPYDEEKKNEKGYTPVKFFLTEYEHYKYVGWIFEIDGDVPKPVSKFRMYNICNLKMRRFFKVLEEVYGDKIYHDKFLLKEV